MEELTKAFDAKKKDTEEKVEILRLRITSIS